MIASLPHFYKAEQLLSGIASGLHPNKYDHGIEILLESVSLFTIATSLNPKKMSK